MSETVTIPELKQIIGALLFAAKEPVPLTHLRKVFAQTAEQHGAYTKDFASVTDTMIEEAVASLNTALVEGATGMQIRTVAHGYRLVNDASCGPWLRVLLEKGKSHRLSRPALETLAIIAYRQPVVRSEIEAVRGVAVDQMIRNLLDMQLIRVMGRSDLPGRPWLFGTTQKFLEHFGINSLDDLPGTAELRRLESEQIKRREREAAQAELPIESEAQLPDETSSDEDFLGREADDSLAPESVDVEGTDSGSNDPQEEPKLP